MKKRRSLFQKAVSLFTGFLLVFQSLTPGFFITSNIFAEDDPTLTVTEAPISTVEPTTAPTSEPTQTITPTPDISPTPEPTALPAIEPTAILEPTATPTSMQEHTPTASPWTFENIKTDTPYEHNGVILTFTLLPHQSGNIKIEDITLTQEQIEQTGALSDKAYDITSNMENGTFTYTLSLPIPESANNKNIAIKYANEIDQLANAQTVEHATIDSDTSISAGQIDHMTIFFVYQTQDSSDGSEQVVSISENNFLAASDNNRMTSDGRWDPFNYKNNRYIDFRFTPNIPTGATVNSAVSINFEYQRDELAFGSYAFVYEARLQIFNQTTNSWDTLTDNVKIDEPLKDKLFTITIPNQYVNTINKINNLEIRFQTIGRKFLSTKGIKTYHDYVALNVSYTLPAPTNGQPHNKSIPTNDFYFEWDTVNDTRPVTYEFQSSNSNSVDGNGSLINAWNSILHGNAEQRHLALPKIHSTGASDGRYYWQVRTINNDGVPGSWSEVWNMTIDRIVPIITIEPYDGTTPTNQNITVTASTNEGDLNTTTHMFTQNGSFDFVATDAAGNITTKTVAITNIDKEAPIIPTGLKFLLQNRTTNLSCGGTVPLQVAIPDWDDNIGDASFHHFEYTSFHPNGNIGLNEQILTVSELNNSWMPPSDGVYGYAVRSVDNVGNKSDWALSAKTLSGSCQIIYDSIQPTIDLVFPTPSTSAHSFQAIFSENVNRVDSENPANYFLNNWPGAGENGDLVGDALITYDAPSKTATITFTNSGWYISPEQQWGVQNIHDLAGNIQQTNPYTEYSTTPTPPVTTDSGIDSNWHNTPVTVTLACTDINGSGCKKTYYTTDGTTPTTASPSGNSFTLSIAGTYTIKYFSIDNAGNVESVKTATNAVKIDTTSPFVQITAPTVSLTNSNSIDIRGTVTDNNPHHYWLVIQNSGGTRVAGPGTVNNSTSFTDQLLFTWNTTSISDGTYTIKLEARDAANNKTTQSVTSKTITIDKTAPEKPVITSPLAEQHFKTSPILNRWNTLTDTSGIKQYTVEYIYDDGHTFSGGPYRYTTTNSRNHSPNINEQGGVTIRVRAEDNAGNLGEWSDSIHYIFDATAPTLTEQTPFEGWYNTPQTSEFTYSDTNGIVSGGEVTCTIESEGANQTCSVTPNVCDAAGNCNTTPVTSNEANIDFTMPTSRITTPENPNSGSTVYTNAWDGSILGTADDTLSGVQGVQISIQNSLGQYFDGDSFIDWEEEILLDTDFIEGNWEYTDLTAPLEGSYLIRSHAIDTAGNIENTYEITIILDKTIPEVALSINPTVGDGKSGWYKTQPVITLTATDEHIDKIEYQWDAQTEGSWITYGAPFTLQNEGAHVLYYRALDLANNYSDTGIKNIAWDKTALEKAPQNVSVSPNPSNGKNVKVTWEAATDNTGIDHYAITWKKDGVGERGTTVSETTREYIIPDTLTEGVWNVKVTAVDKAGFTADASVNATVDLTAPAAPTLALTGTGVGSVSLAWNAVEGAVDYSIWYGTTPGVYDYAAHVGNVTSYTIQGLGAGTYYVVVAAYDNVVNRSAFSNEVNTGGAIAGAPGATGPAEGFQPAGTVLGSETVDTEKEGQALGTTTTAAPGFSWWFILIGLLLIIIVTYLYYRQRRRNR